MLGWLLGLLHQVCSRVGNDAEATCGKKKYEDKELEEMTRKRENDDMEARFELVKKAF